MRRYRQKKEQINDWNLVEVKVSACVSVLADINRPLKPKQIYKPLPDQQNLRQRGLQQMTVLEVRHLCNTT